MSHALQILEAVIRRHRQTHGDAPMAEADAITLRQSALIPADLTGALSFDERVWQVRPVKGALSLRAALLDGTPTIMVLSGDFKVPRDIEQRRWLRRSLQVNAQDVVSAATGHYCRPLTDSAVAQAVLDDPEGFFDRASKRRWHGPAISEADVVSVLRSGSVQVGRRSAPELLARWLLEGPPEADPFLRTALKEAHFEIHDWLMLATTADGQQQLVTAGALGAIKAGRACVRFDLPTDADKLWSRLVTLLQQALAVVRSKDPDRARALLEPANALAQRLELDFDDARRLTLLPAGFEQAVTGLVHRMATRSTPGPEAFEQLGVHLFADEALVEGLEALARLARFATRYAIPDEGVDAWATEHRASVAWADLCARQVRRIIGRLPEAARAPAQSIVQSYLTARDRQNAAFASALARDEISAHRRRPTEDGMSLHLLSAQVLVPILEQRPVFLVVLDGCDMSTFYELLDDLRGAVGLGLGTLDGLSAHAAELPPLMSVISPVPTLTEVGRRAIFAGQVPQNDVLTDLENAAANAKSDRAAFKRNAALGEIDRSLWLKGDLHDDCEALVTALKGDTPLVAAVFNGVDDHLSSREVIPHGLWTVDGVHPGLRHAIRAAVQARRAVILTSDHGHTPYWSADRKTLAPARSSQRFAQGEPPQGATTFKGTPWRAGELHALSQVGAFVSVQRAGYHGGASLEEVVVPVAQIVQDGRSASRPPWWTHTIEEISTADEQIPEMLDAFDDDLDMWWHAAPLAVQELIRFLDTHGQITEADAARITQKRRSFRKLATTLDKLQKEGVLPWQWQRNTQGGMARIVKKGAL
ncbi:MAG: BREX-2 system phosphatase PglZ [Bradymonadia bacterium]